MDKEKRTLWEMHTPYGIYTLIGTFQEATVVSILLAQGGYKIKEAFGSRSVPLLSAGNYDFWALDNFNMPLDDIVRNTDKVALAEVLNSVIKADKYERLNYEENMKLMKTPEQKEKYKHNWNEENDSGIHDITGQAWLLSNYFIPKQNSSELFV